MIFQICRATNDLTRFRWPNSHWGDIARCCYFEISNRSMWCCDILAIIQQLQYPIYHFIPSSHLIIISCIISIGSYKTSIAIANALGILILHKALCVKCNTKRSINLGNYCGHQFSPNFCNHSSESINPVLSATFWNVECASSKFVCGTMILHKTANGRSSALRCRVDQQMYTHLYFLQRYFNDRCIPFQSVSQPRMDTVVID